MSDPVSLPDDYSCDDAMLDIASVMHGELGESQQLLLAGHLCHCEPCRSTIATAIVDREGGSAPSALRQIENLLAHVHEQEPNVYYHGVVQYVDETSGRMSAVSLCDVQCCSNR